MDVIFTVAAPEAEGIELMSSYVLDRLSTTGTPAAARSMLQRNLETKSHNGANDMKQAQRKPSIS